MSKGLELLEKYEDKYTFASQSNGDRLSSSKTKEMLEPIEKELKALEIIKKHIVNKDLDTSGVYLEYCLGLFEPYYSIEIKRGANQIITEKEYDLLKEVLL